MTTPIPTARWAVTARLTNQWGAASFGSYVERALAERVAANLAARPDVQAVWISKVKEED